MYIGNSVLEITLHLQQRNKVLYIYQRENEENRSTGDYIKRMQRTYFPRASQQTGFE